MNWNRKGKDMRGRWRPRETKGQAILGGEIRGAREGQRGFVKGMLLQKTVLLGKPPGVAI